MRLHLAVGNLDDESIAALVVGVRGNLVAVEDETFHGRLLSSALPDFRHDRVTITGSPWRQALI